MRRFGPAAALLVPAGYLLIDAVGSDRSAPPPERAAAGAAIATYTTAWWAGVIVGVAGELAGVEHRHRSAPS